jgi:hypothetical protein
VGSTEDVDAVNNTAHDLPVREVKTDSEVDNKDNDDGSMTTTTTMTMMTTTTTTPGSPNQADWLSMRVHGSGNSRIGYWPFYRFAHFPTGMDL